jgi:hypothetical protein
MPSFYPGHKCKISKHFKLNISKYRSEYYHQFRSYISYLNLWFHFIVHIPISHVRSTEKIRVQKYAFNYILALCKFTLIGTCKPINILIIFNFKLQIAQGGKNCGIQEVGENLIETFHDETTSFVFFEDRVILLFRIKPSTQTLQGLKQISDHLNVKIRLMVSSVFRKISNVVGKL